MPRLTNVASSSQLAADILTGDLTATGAQLIAVAQNATVSKPFTITIAPAQLVITTVGCPSGQVGVAYTCTLAASGGVGPYTWTAVGALPTGFTLSPAGVISGTPTAPGTFAFTITVTDNAGSLPARIKVQGNVNKS